MVSSHLPNSRNDITSVVSSLVSLTKKLSYLTAISMLVLLLLSYLVFSLVTTNRGQMLAEVPVRPLPAEPPLTAQSAVLPRENQDQQVNEANARAEESQRILEESQALLADTQQTLQLALERQEELETIAFEMTEQQEQDQQRFDLEMAEQREGEQQRIALEVAELRAGEQQRIALEVAEQRAGEQQRITLELDAQQVEERSRREENQRLLDEMRRQLAASQAENLELVRQLGVQSVENVSNVSQDERAQEAVQVQAQALPEAIVRTAIREETAQVEVQSADRGEPAVQPVELVEEVLIARPPQDYPRRALNRGVEGSCEVKFTVSTTGTVVDPEIISCDPNGYFDQASLNAASEFEYSPRFEDGVPVPVSDVRFVFRYGLQQ